MGGDEDSSVERGARQIIEKAIAAGASDVHIEPRDRLVAVRYRRGGRLQLAAKLPRKVARALAEHLKQLADLEPWQTESPQSGRYELEVGRRAYSLDISTLPVFDGEKITIHIEEVAADLPSLEDLGFWGESLAALKHALAQPSGLAVVGARGRASEVSLPAMLQTLKSGVLKTAFISSQEAPTVPSGLETFLIQPAVGSTAANHLQRLRRQGYEAIAIDLIGDRATAEAAFEISKSVLVLAGLPMLGAVRGLAFWQRALPLHTLAAPVRAAVGQTFVPSLCPHCSVADTLTGDEQKTLTALFGLDKATNIKRLHQLEQQAAAELGVGKPLGSSEQGILHLWRKYPAGCKECTHSGYGPQIGLSEVCVPNEKLLGLLAKSAPLTDLQKAAITSGMISLPTDCLIKALRGLIDLETLLNVCKQYGLQ